MQFVFLHVSIQSDSYLLSSDSVRVYPMWRKQSYQRPSYLSLRFWATELIPWDLHRVFNHKGSTFDYQRVIKFKIFAILFLKRVKQHNLHLGLRFCSSYKLTYSSFIYVMSWQQDMGPQGRRPRPFITYSRSAAREASRTDSYVPDPTWWCDQGPVVPMEWTRVHPGGRSQMTGLWAK